MLADILREMRWGHWDFSLLARLDECQDCEARELCDSFRIGFSALRARKFTVLNSQGTSPDRHRAGQGWDALGQQGGEAVDQPPLSTDLDSGGHRSGPSPKQTRTTENVCACARVREREGVRERVCACVGGGRGRDTPIRREVGDQEVLGGF